jgi:hypothetical protein
MTIEQMIEALSHFPHKSCCVPKEGEVTGSEIRTPEGDKTLGYIPTSEPSVQDIDTSEVVF